MPMQAIPAASLEVVQATFLLGIFVKLLDDPASVCQGDQPLERGLWRQRTEPVLRLLHFLLWFGFLLSCRVVRWRRLIGRRRRTGGQWHWAFSEQPALRAGVDARVTRAVPRRTRSPVHADGDGVSLHRAFG